MKRILCFLIILAAIVSNTVAAEPIRLSMKDTTVVRGTTFLYPVMVDSSLTGYNITAYELDFNYDGGAFHIDSIIVNGTLTQNWGVPTYHDYLTHVTIAGAGTQSLVGTGVLFYLKLTAPSSSGSWGSSFQFTKAMLNEGAPSTSTRNGTIWISNLPIITVNPDAATINVGDKQQFWIAGGTSPYQWSTTNPSVAIIDTNGLLTAVNAGYCRVAAKDQSDIKDTSGLIDVRAFRMIIRDTSFLQGQTFNIPIYITDLSQIDVTSGQFTITYDPNLLSYLGSIQTSTLLESYTAPTIRAVANRLEISFAGSSRLNGVGTQVLMYLRFRASIQYTGGSWLNISNLLFNQNIWGLNRDGVVNVNNRTILTLTPNSTDILVGDSLQFTVGGSPQGPLTWTTSDTSVASISQSGLLQALKNGTVIVSIADTIGKIGVSQNINIYDIRLSMPDSSALSRDSIILPIYITKYTPGIIGAQMIVKVDTNYFENLSVITDGTLTGGLGVYSFARRETLTIATANATPITGPGILWKVKFHIRYGAPKLSTTQIRMVGVLFNEGTPKPLIINGNFYIRWEKDVAVADILEPVGIVAWDSVVTPRVRVQNVRGVAQMTTVRFKIGTLYSDSIIVGLNPYETKDLTYPRSWHATPTGTHVLQCDALLSGDQDTSNNVLIRNLAVVRTGAEPVILSLAPNHGGNNGIVSTIIHGQHFKRGATVKLTKNSYPDYVVDTAYIRVLDSTKIRVVFDFYYQPTGTWNVIVTNPDSGTTTFFGGFTIEEPSTKHVWTSIVGNNRIRIGRDQSYTIMYGNTGNVDAVGVLLLIRGIPRGTEWKLDFSFYPAPSLDSISWKGSPDIIDLPTERVLPIFIPILRANQTCQISFRLKVPWGTPRFELTAGIKETETHLYNPLAPIIPPFSSLAIAGATGIQDINWDCVTSIGQLVLTVLEAFAPRECFNLAANSIVGLASLTTESELKWSLVKFIASEVKDAAFCAGYIFGAEIAIPLKVASMLTDLFSGGYDIYQKCFPDPVTKLPILPVASMDPNYKLGPSGFDTTYHYATVQQPLYYSIDFENLAAATAPAETIVVRDTLDTNLDWSTLNLEAVSHPAYLTTELDSASRTITWRFNGINLPPNVNPPEGEGWTRFNIKPKQNLASGKQIKNSATIVFDYNPPLTTNTYINTIDSGKPSSNVLPLPDTTSSGEVTVHWMGKDDSLGSGIRSYDIYVKYDAGAYIRWLTGTTDTMATFIGDNERVHSFYSIATDNVGWQENPPVVPDAVTYVKGLSSPLYRSPANGKHINKSKPVFTWSPTAGNQGHYKLQYSADSAFVINVHAIDSLADTVYTSTDSLADGKYFWRVEAISRLGSHSGYRTPSWFIVDTQPPNTPLLLSLTDGASIKVATPSFRWTNATEIGGKYYWECATDTLFDSVKAAYISSDTTITVLQNMSLNRGVYYWHVRSLDKAMNMSPFQSHPYMFSIDTTFVGVREQKGLPVQFALYQNYPNPFNPQTIIQYDLPVISRVKLKIYNLLGQEIITLLDEIQPAGYRFVEWNSTNNNGVSIATGVYFYKLEATSIANSSTSFTKVKKLLLIR